MNMIINLIAAMICMVGAGYMLRSEEPWLAAIDFGFAFLNIAWYLIYS